MCKKIITLMMVVFLMMIFSNQLVAEKAVPKGAAPMSALKIYLDNPPDFNAAIEFQVSQNPEKPGQISVLVMGRTDVAVADMSVSLMFPPYLVWKQGACSFAEPFNQWDVVEILLRQEEKEKGNLSYLTVFGICDVGGEYNPYFRSSEMQNIVKIDFTLDEIAVKSAQACDHLIVPVVDIRCGPSYFGDIYGIHSVQIEVPEYDLNADVNIALGKIIGDEALLPTVFSIDQNYPNPFNAITRINYGLPRECHVTIEVFNVLGQTVQRVVNSELMPAGYHSVAMDASNLSSGVYFYQILADDFVQTRKMMLLK